MSAVLIVALVAATISSGILGAALLNLHHAVRPQIEVGTTSLTTRNRKGGMKIGEWRLTIANTGPFDYKNVAFETISCPHGHRAIDGLYLNGTLKESGSIGALKVGEVATFGYEAMTSHRSEYADECSGGFASGHGRLRITLKRGIRTWKMVTPDIDFKDAPAAGRSKCPACDNRTVVTFSHIDEIAEQRLPTASAKCECGQTVNARFSWNLDDGDE